jgi:hypothetical protein
MTLGISSRVRITDDRPRGVDPTQTHFEANLKTSVSSVPLRVLRATPFLHLNCVTSNSRAKPARLTYSTCTRPPPAAKWIHVESIAGVWRALR